MSKRIPTHKRLRLEKKAREALRKQRKAQTKTQKVPPSVLRTDEERSLLRRIDEAQRLRNEISTNTADITNFDSLYDSVFLQSVIASSSKILYFIDCRDPIGSFTEDILDEKKDVIFVLSRVEGIPSGVLSEWVDNFKARGHVLIFSENTDLSNLLEDLNGIFQEKNHVVGVVGQKNVGKHLFLSKLRTISDSSHNDVVGKHFAENEKTRSISQNSEVPDSCEKIITETFPIRDGPHENQEDIIKHQIKHSSFTIGPITFLSLPGVIECDTSFSSVFRGSTDKFDVNVFNAAKDLISTCGLPELCIYYGVYADTPNAFLKALALKLDFVVRGVPDTRKAASKLLVDISASKLSFHTRPNGTHAITIN